MIARTARSRRAVARGRLSRADIRDAVSSIHVYPAPAGKWMVKEIGMRGVRKLFASQRDAVAFAKATVARKDLAGVLVHRKQARLRVSTPAKAGVYEVVFGND